MPYPPYLARQISYRQNESAGNEIPTAVLDSEFNDRDEVVNQINQRIRGITDVTGRLINVAAQIAMTLVGTQRFAPVVLTTVFLTTITWDSSFSSGNVLVGANGAEIDPNTVTVANNGGFLQVTLATGVSSGWVRVAAYSQGAGILTRLGLTTNGNGASLIGIEDVGGFYTAVEVEDALQEIATNLAALLTTLGTLSKLWTSDGVTIAAGPATAAFNLGGFNVSNMADAVAATDAVTLQQLQAFTQDLNTLLSLFVRVDGLNPFTGDQSMGGHRLTDVGAAVQPGDAINKAEFNAIDGAQITTGLVPGPRLTPFVGDTGTGGVQGAVPAPAVGDAAANKFLGAGGSFINVPSNLGGYIILQDQKPSGTQGGSSSTATWTTRVLNTEVIDTQNACTLAANQFTLVAGTYRIKASSVLYRGANGTIRIRDVTNSVTVAVGTPGFSAAATDFASVTSTLDGYFTTLGATFELQYFVGTAHATNGLGNAVSSGEVEVYSTISLTKE